MILIEPIQNIISTCLNNFQYQDAIFISERLHSELQTEESLYLLSLSHYRSHKTLKAYHLLKSRYLTLAKCKYLLSKCCIDLNKFGEAETILTECTFTKQKLYDEIIKEYGEYSCFVLQILAFVYSKTDRTSQAIEFHKKCLRLNPFLWSSFESLCVLGEKLDPYKYFTTNSAIQFYTTHILTNQNYQNNNNNNNNNSGCQINNNTFTINLNTNANQTTNNSTANTSIDQLFAFTNTNKPQNVQNLSLSDLFVVKENSYNNIDDLNYSKSSTKTELSETTNTSQLQQPSQQQQATQQQQHDTSIGMISESHKTNTKLLNVTSDSNSNDLLNSLHTPPPQPLITANVAPAKKITKRLPVKPLSGKNSGNLANIPLSHNTHQTTFSNIQTVRRSSRIFAQSANAVKENKKLPTTNNNNSSSTTSSSTTGGVNATSSSSGGTTTNAGGGLNNNSKLNKRLKIKKKSTTTTSLSNSSSTSSSISAESPTKHDSQANISSTNTTTTTNTNQNQDKLGSISYPAVKFFQKSNIIDDTERLSLENMMKLLRDIGFGVVNLHQYECKKALEYFEDIPLAHYQSSYVLGCIGKALFELHNYQKAEQIYLQLRQLHPYHLEGLEYYSTVLWHLQKEIALSSLAQELIEYDKLAPETWCVVGNCFSLHKEHDAAIKFFQRATQINSNFVYAYNLLGHEYFLIEEMEKGLSCFRKAIFLDSRHYNAWYGISMINLKQEKFLLAENYLKKALMINPHSSTLMCHIAVVYHSMKKSEKALEILERALEIEPKNFLCKFHRASILFSMGKYEMALRDFERLRRQIPKESLIYYMISKTHKKLRNIHLSLMYMSWAMDLDPKGVNNQLKESIDKRYVVDNDSTFARELETINTSTLDAIYGVDSSANNGDDNSETAGGGGVGGAGVGSYDGARANNDLTVDGDIVEQNDDEDKDESSFLSASLYVNKITNLLSTDHNISSVMSPKPTTTNTNYVSITSSIATTSSAGGGASASMDASIGGGGGCSILMDSHSKKISMSSSTSLVEEHSLFMTRDLLDNNNTIEHDNSTTNNTTNNNNNNTTANDDSLILNNSQSTQQDQAMDLNEDQ